MKKNRNFRIAPGTIAIFLGISIFNSINSSSDININKNNTIPNITISNIFDLKDEKDVDVLSSLNENNNITGEEKNKIRLLSDMIDENPYLDRRQAAHALKKLKIEYNCQRPENLNSTVKATYSNTDYTIRVYDSKESTSDEILLHETVHALFLNYKTVDLPNYFVEGMTELLVNEYISNHPYYEYSTYPYEIMMVKILCELVGEDNVLKTYSTGNMDIIKDKLETIGGTEKTDKFLNNINQIFIDYQAGKTINEVQYNEVLSYLDSYFVYLNENGNEESYNNYLYFRNIISLINTINPNQEYYNYIFYDDDCLDKAYFSKKLKNNTYNSSKVLRK